jgi:DNA-binding CsgD family transcriptional regulator/PAS domain-containing protein
MPDSSLLRSITGGICDAALAPDAWSDVLRQLTEYLGAVGAAYILTNKRTGQVEWISLAGPGAELQSDYVAHFAAVDPYRPLLDGSPGWLRVSESLPRTVLARDEWYNDFVLRVGVGDILGANIYSGPSHEAVIGLHYGLHRRGFTSAREARVRELIGLMRKAAELHVRLNNAGWQSSVAWRALDQLAAAVIIADRDARIVRVNRAGEDLLSRGCALSVRHGKLCTGRSFETDKLRALIGAAAVPDKLDPAIGRMLVGSRDRDLPCVLTVARLTAELSVFDRPLAMVLAAAPEQRLLAAADLAELFGLSPAESRLAVALMGGKKLHDITIETGVGISTLRSQLSAILKKVGADRQVDLIRILTSVPVVSTPSSRPE